MSPRSRDAVIPTTDMFGDRMTADELVQWRTLRRIRQVELSRILGVHQASLSRWETGDQSVPGWMHLALESIHRRLTLLNAQGDQIERIETAIRERPHNGKSA